jgi:hypothetical protein
MPLSALYNPVLDKFKQGERDNEVDPTPLTVVVMKDKKSEAVQYLMQNEQRGIKLLYNPQVHGQSKALVHSTGKVVWVNNNAGQKASAYTRRELMSYMNGDLDKTIAKNHKLFPQIKDKQMKRQPSRLIGLVRDFLEGKIDKEVIRNI